MNTDLPATATITGIRQLTADTGLFTLLCSDAADAAVFLPGQFLELSLPGIGEIPISYCGIPGADNRIELCIRRAGHVTTPLLRAETGDRVGVRGPFGQGFPLRAYMGQDLILIAGGLGMAPLRSLLLALLRQRENWGELTLLYAAREPGALLFLDELLASAHSGSIRLLLAVDRPGQNQHYPPGCTVALLPDLLDKVAIRAEQTYAAVCGPPGVYPSLVAALMNMGLASGRIHLSLERRMKCGLGRCGHCAVGSWLCCTNGPVFSYDRLQGIEGALA